MAIFIRFTALFLTLVMMFPAVSCGENETNQTSYADHMKSAVNSLFATDAKTLAPMVGDLIDDLFDDYKILYGESYFIVRVSTQGLAGKLQAAYEEGHGENWGPWIEYKDFILAVYEDIIDLFESNGRADIGLDLWVWNDDALAGNKTRFGIYLTYASKLTSKHGIFLDVMLRLPLPVNRATEPVEDPSLYPNQSDLDAIYATFDLMCREIGFDYYNFTHNESNHSIYVEVAIDGLTERLINAREAGNTPSWKPWQQTKLALKELYDAFKNHLADVGRSDLRVSLSVVNDDAFLRGDNGTINFNPLYSISILGIPMFDVME